MFCEGIKIWSFKWDAVNREPVPLTGCIQCIDLPSLSSIGSITSGEGARSLPLVIFVLLKTVGAPIELALAVTVDGCEKTIEEEAVCWLEVFGTMTAVTPVGSDLPLTATNGLAG